MAVEQKVQQLSFRAGADLSGKQFHFVKLNSNGEVIACAALTDVPIGVLQNKPTLGKTAEVVTLGLAKVVADETLAPGDLVGPSADARAAVRDIGTDVTHYVAGQVVEGSGTGGVSSILINCMNPLRAA